MNLGRASLCWLVAGLLAMPLCAAPPAQASERRAPASSQTRMAKALREAVAHHVADAGLVDSLRGYSLSPAIVQLRRYVDGKHTKVVCVVSLALKTDSQDVVAEIRGSAATVGGTSLEALDAAAHSAVSRLPDALSKLPVNGAGRLAQR